MKITIKTQISSNNEMEQLKEYLKNNHGDFIIEEHTETIYVLSDNKINDIIINDKIIDNQLFEYEIRDRTDFIENLIGWIGEADGNNKVLMLQDLEMLLNVTDDYIFSSISTNDYIYIGCGNFDETCMALLELNETIK